MKIANTPTEITSSGDLKDLSFGIREEDQGLILDILRSKMYSNPIRIICQEIASNARDANREAGKAHTPIRIKVTKEPFTEDIKFVVEDDGPGISPERMEEIYINYGASTKRGSNRMTGGFGLGCKTPFSYVDSFSIITKVDGVKYTYQAAIQENQSGSLFLFSKEETSDPNGTSIQIPIEGSDAQYFIINSLEVTHFWPIKPKFILDSCYNHYLSDPKFDIPPEKVVYSDDKISIMRNRVESYGYRTFMGDGYYALIDGIPYELDGDLMKWPPIRNIVVLIKMGNGSVSVSANRESIHYDSKSTTYLQKRMQSFLDSTAKRVKACFLPTDDLQTVKMLACYHLRQYGALIGRMEFKRQDTTFNIDATSCVRLQYHFIQKYSKGFKRTVVSYMPDDGPAYFMDRTSISGPRNGEIFKKGSVFYLICKHCGITQETQVFADEEEKRIRRVLGGIPLYSSVKYTRVITKRAPSAKKKEIISCYKIVGSMCRVEKREVDTSILNPGCIYATYQVKRDVGDDPNRIWYYALSKVLAKNFYFIKKNQVGLVKGAWVDFDTAFKNSKGVLSKYSDAVFMAQHKYSFSHYSKFKFPQDLRRALDYLNSGTSVNSISVGNLNFPSTFLKMFPPSDEAREYLKILESIEKRYPLLPSIRYTSTKFVNEYITLKDRENLWTSVGLKPQSTLRLFMKGKLTPTKKRTLVTRERCLLSPTKIKKGSWS